MSRLGSPGDQSVCVVLTCRRMDRDRLDIVTESLQELCRMVLQGEESHKEKDPVKE